MSDEEDPTEKRASESAAKRASARPYKFTWAVAEKVCAAIRAGNPRETAAACVGVTAHTFRNWLKRGAEGEEPFVQFADECAQIEAAYQATIVQVLFKRLESADIRELLEILKHRFPKQWNPTLAVQLSGAIATVAAPVATPAAARAAMRELFNLEAPEAPADMFALAAHADPDAPK